MHCIYCQNEFSLLSVFHLKSIHLSLLPSPYPSLSLFHSLSLFVCRSLPSLSYLSHSLFFFLSLSLSLPLIKNSNIWIFLKLIFDIFQVISTHAEASKIGRHIADEVLEKWRSDSNHSSPQTTTGNSPSNTGWILQFCDVITVPDPLLDVFSYRASIWSNIKATS